jgi:uncharacterized protein (DUF1697 family)
VSNYIIFLRGVNVVGHTTVKMEVLKKALSDNKFEDVKTYINSGNILLKSKEDKIQLKEKIKQIILENFGVSVEMIIKTKDELENIIEKDPFNPEKETDNSRRIVVMLSEKIDKNKATVFKEEKKVVENYYAIDDLLYIYYHNGAGQSKFTNTYIEKKLHVISTTRNWNTLLKIQNLI